MKKFIVRGNSNYDYDIYETENSKNPIDLEKISPVHACTIRCVALINYFVDYNKKQCDFYKKEEGQVVTALMNLFDKNSKIKADDILNYFGVQYNGEIEWGAIHGLTEDVCNDLNHSSNLYNAAYIYFKQQHEMDTDNLIK